MQTTVRDRVIVRPVAGSRRFAPANTTLNYEREVNGRGEVIKSELYKGQKIPDSQQGIPVMYSEKRRTYLLDFEYLEKFGGLQKIVDDMAFTHETGVKAGELITTCNPANRTDAFILAMRKQRPYMKEGEIILYPDDAANRFWIAALRANRDYSDNIEQIAGRNVVVVGTKYQMITESAEIAKKAEESNIKEKAFDSLKELRKKGDEFARKVGIICGASTEVVSDSRTLYPYLVEYLDNAKTPSKPEPMLSQQQFFIQICNRTQAEVELMYLLRVGMNKGFIKLLNSPSGVPYYSYNKKNLGSNLEEVYDFLQNGENIDLYTEIRESVKLVNV